MGDIIRLVCGGQRCQKGVGGQRDSCLQTACVYIPEPALETAGSQRKCSYSA